MAFDTKFLTEVMTDLFGQQEKLILEQLGDLIKKGLLVVEQTVPVLIRESNSDKIILQQAVKLVLKDKEYITKLEKENEDLKQRLKIIEGALNEICD